MNELTDNKNRNLTTYADLHIYDNDNNSEALLTQDLYADDDTELLNRAQFISNRAKGHLGKFDAIINDPTDKTLGTKEESSEHQNSTYAKPSEIKKSFELFPKKPNYFKENTFYQNIKQFRGTVQSVNAVENVFTARLVSMDGKGDELLAEFSIKDLSCKSDRELLRAGALFVWLMGQEVEHGTATNISQFVFQRTRVIQKRGLQEAKENARKLAEFFEGIGTSDTSK